MTVDIKRWLCDQFIAIDSVRTAKILGDLIAIHTWSGVVIYAYVLEEPTKARTIKRIVQENTRIGIGTLFIVSAEIVPDDGARIEPDEGGLGIARQAQDEALAVEAEPERSAGLDRPAVEEAPHAFGCERRGHEVQVAAAHASRSVVRQDLRVFWR